jgi:hypothetical protein
MWLAILSSSLSVCFQSDREFLISFISYSSICLMRDTIGCHYVEIQKSVESTAWFFLIMTLTCLLMYQGIAGQDIFTGCLLSLPNGYYLTWLLLLATESGLLLISVNFLPFHYCQLSLWSWLSTNVDSTGNSHERWCTP